MPSTLTTPIAWTGGAQPESLEALRRPGGLVVSPTKVGYILIASDAEGLERKFSLKQRRRNKPAVVLCGSLHQLEALAVLDSHARELYRRHWEEDLLLGCILPWRDAAWDDLPVELRGMVADPQRTSCFVIRCGEPAEALAAELWTRRRIAFASSANPSGQGNRGLVAGIGERIREGADVIVADDAYVAARQPLATQATRFEQGVMVSLVDADGELVPDQRHQRGVSPVPTLIRRGLDVERIMTHLSELYPRWDHRHGQYY